jgi:hypothetical protein
MVCAHSDLSKETLLQHPSMYATGLRNLNLNLAKMAEWILHALILAVVVFWVTYGAFSEQGVLWDPKCVQPECVFCRVVFPVFCR